jgi:hypothetical protein
MDFPIYNQIVELPDGRWQAFLQSASGAVHQKRFRLLEEAQAWAKHRALTALPRENWVSEIISLDAALFCRGYLIF